VRAVLIDLGGVLETGCWPGIAKAWTPRLGITTGQMLAAVFGGSDDTVLAWAPGGRRSARRPGPAPAARVPDQAADGLTVEGGQCVRGWPGASPYWLVAAASVPQTAFGSQRLPRPIVNL